MVENLKHLERLRKLSDQTMRPECAQCLLSMVNEGLLSIPSGDKDVEFAIKRLELEKEYRQASKTTTKEL